GRCGVGAETVRERRERVREWRERGPGDRLDRSARPREPPWEASGEERAVVCARRRATGFPLDDLAFVVRRSLPHPGRDDVPRLPTGRGGRLTAEGFGKRRREPGVEHRETRPCTPRTNGTAERLNGRVQREVLGVTVAGRRDLERLLAGFDQACDARRQRVPD